MKWLTLTATVGAACLALAGCSRDDGNATGTATPAGDSTVNTGDAAGTQTAASSWPKGARIVEEDGVTYRIDADGNRVRLGDTDARIVVENGTRYRVTPDGTRVRIDERGLDIDLPDVDVGINEKGNLDVDVGDRDADGGR